MDEVAKLLTAARESRLVIFAGAGISMGPPTNLPSWRDVNRSVVCALAAAAVPVVGGPSATMAAELILARHAQEKLPPEYQAQILAEFLHTRYFEVLRHLDSDCPNATHLAIAWLARLGCVRAVITTNFDRVMEAAFTAVGAPFERYYQPEHFSALARELARLDQCGGPCHLLKLHGSVDNPATLIDTLAQRKRGLATPVIDCVRHLLLSSQWLFLGFSGLDLEAEPNYLALAQEAERATGFSWFVRAGTEPKPAVVRLRNLYGERGGLVEGKLPEWLLDFAGSISSQPRAWIEEYLRLSVSTDQGANTVALEQAVAKWAADLNPNISALALAFVVIACAEPQTAVQLVERVLQAIEARHTALENSSDGFLLEKGIAANALGVLLAGLGRHEEALDWLTSGVELAQAAGDDDSRDRIRGNLAQSLETLGRIDEAREAYQSALAGYRSRGEPLPLAFGLTSLASHLIRQAHLDEAQALAGEAIQWAAKAGDERMRGTALNDLGMIAKLRGEYAMALHLFAEVEELFARLGNDEAVAAAAGNRGEVLAALGEFDEAERIQRRVLQVNERLERRDNQGADCLSLGSLERLRGNPAAAESWFARALEIYTALQDPSNEALALLRLAQVKMDIGQFEEALVLAESAVPRVSERNAAFTSDLWNQIGLASFKVGRIGRAEEAYRKVHTLSGTIAATEGVHAMAAMNLGTALLLQQRDDEAATSFAESASYWQRVNHLANLDYCRLGERAVQLDQKIAALSDAGHAAPTSSEMRAAATEMIALYPELIEMYTTIGATVLVAEFCSSAASTAKVVGELDKAGRWYRRAADVFHSIGREDRARESLERSEELLRNWTNALIEQEEFARALPDVLLLAEVAEQLGHGEMCGSAFLNAAIIIVRTSQDYTRAKTLAERSLAFLHADSSDIRSAQMVISHCSNADHDRTRLAQSRVDDVTAVAPNSLQWIQHRSGNVHTLLLGNGKIAVFGFTTSEMALRVLDLIARRFPGDYLIAQAEGLPRALFEQGAMADGRCAEDYWFVYEGTEEFTRLMAGLEAHQPPPA